ncbi:MAG: hypothetical protein VXZ82_06565 [Planctomycetota bacterium]|nr:hypothetical protein [Planctomycetota bacterium]
MDQGDSWDEATNSVMMWLVPAITTYDGHMAVRPMSRDPHVIGTVNGTPEPDRRSACKDESNGQRRLQEPQANLGKTLSIAR